jgi:hypothetical protein
MYSTQKVMGGKLQHLAVIEFFCFGPGTDVMIKNKIRRKNWQKNRRF